MLLIDGNGEKDSEKLLRRMLDQATFRDRPRTGLFVGTPQIHLPLIHLSLLF